MKNSQTEEPMNPQPLRELFEKETGKIRDYINAIKRVHLSDAPICEDLDNILIHIDTIESLAASRSEGERKGHPISHINATPEFLSDPAKVELIKKMTDKAYYAGKPNQELFNVLYDMGFIAVESDMREIIDCVHKHYPAEGSTDKEIEAVRYEYNDMELGIIADNEWRTGSNKMLVDMMKQDHHRMDIYRAGFLSCAAFLRSATAKGREGK